jgi:tripartite-type tricarboxylate transporter receptor subunit TctC
VVGFTTGGPSDVIARGLAQKMSLLLGQPIVVDNKPGAGGNVAAEYVAHSDPDGYTWLLGNNSILATNEFLYKGLRYRPEQDFAPVGLVAIQPNILIVNNALPVKNLKELISLLKSHPGQFNFASSGAGAAAHLSGEMFKTSAGVNMTHIPYKGAGPATTALLGEQIQVLITTPPSVLPYIKDGRFKAIAYTVLKRASFLPDVPTVAEQGFPNFEIDGGWFGLFTTAGTPPDTVNKIQQLIQQALENKSVKDSIVQIGLDPVIDSPDHFKVFVESEQTRYAERLKLLNIKAQE